MMTANDFNKKQIVFVLANNGEKMSFRNDNLVVTDREGKVKMQCTCYRLFIICVIGHCSITTALIQRAKRFGVFFVLMTTGFRVYSVIGSEKEGNTLLRQKQYQYDSLDLAKHIINNKMANQISVLKGNRNKSQDVKDSIRMIENYRKCMLTADARSEILSYEGLASKLYFKHHFNNCEWRGRQPRLKRDPINSTLDIGYTVLFSFIDSILSCFGFDTYRGVFHTQFYMRKSLVCDLVEPFRVLIDCAVKRAIGLKQIQDDDFLVINKQYQLKWECTSKYIQFLVKPLLDNRDSIFIYVQQYYRAFMKELPALCFPNFEK